MLNPSISRVSPGKTGDEAECLVVSVEQDVDDQLVSRLKRGLSWPSDPIDIAREVYNKVDLTVSSLVRSLSVVGCILCWLVRLASARGLPALEDGL